jgi:hypothetical protein
MAKTTLWHIVLDRMRCHQPTRDYLARRTAEGKTKSEIMRCLKRYIAPETYPYLAQPQSSTTRSCTCPVADSNLVTASWQHSTRSRHGSVTRILLSNIADELPHEPQAACYTPARIMDRLQLWAEAAGVEREQGFATLRSEIERDLADAARSG